MKLLTNLRWVSIELYEGLHRIHTGSNALLIHGTICDAGACGPPWWVRGFGTEGAWLTFECRLSSPAFTWGQHEPYGLMRSPGGELLQGNVMRFEHGPVVFLSVEDPWRPVRVDELPEEALSECWVLLERRVREFWRSDCMPHLAWGDPKEFMPTLF